MENLKEKLLSLGVFEDNEYLDFYCKLIESNRETKKEKFKTQRHHIIPKFYYKRYKLEIDNSFDNLVNLYYYDHLLAHYYLCLMLRDKQLKYAAENSFLHMLNGNSNYKIRVENVDVTIFKRYQDIYESFKKHNSELQKGNKAWNKGLTKNTDERVAKYSNVKRSFSKEHNENLGRSLKKYYKTHVNSMKDKTLSNETKDRISKSNRGKTRKSKTPKETSIKLSNSLKLYYQEHPEARDRIINYNINKKISKEMIEKIRNNQPNRQAVIQLDSNYKIITIFNSINDACRKLEIKRWRVCNACKTGKLLKEGFYLKYEQQ